MGSGQDKVEITLLLFIGYFLDKFILNPLIRSVKRFNCLVHPCDKEDKAGCSHECERDGALFKCICREGFTLDYDGKKCNKGTN